LGPVHMTAGLPHPFLVSLQIQVQMSQRVVLDGTDGIAQGLELRQGVQCLPTLVDEAGAHMLHRLLQRGVCKCCPRILFEGGRRDLHYSLPMPIAGRSSMPASTSATCLTFIPLPCR